MEAISCHELLDAVLQEMQADSNSPAITALRQAISQLEDRAKRYRELFEYAPDAYIVTDANGTIHTANRAATVLWGESPLGKNLGDLVAVEAQEQLHRLLGQLVRGINVKTADLRMKVASGQTFEATLTIMSVRDSGGKVVGMRWWIQDTTERQQDEILLRRSHQQQEIRQAELQTKLAMLDRQMRSEREELRRVTHSLARSEAKLRALLQYSSDIVYIIDLDTSIQYASPAISHILGYQPEEVTGRKFVQFVHPEDLPRLQELLARLMSSPALSMPIVLRHRHNSGDWVYMESVCNNLLQDTNVQGIVVNSRDITERRKAEAALLESELRLGAIAASMPGTFYRLQWSAEDDSLSLPYISDGLVDMAGMSPSQAMANPKRLLDLIHPEDREQVKAIMKAAKERLATFRREFRIITKTGEIKWVQDIARYYKDPLGNVLADGVCIDITERGDAETELQRLHELLQAVIRTVPVALDLVNPEHEVLLWNPMAEQVFGWMVGEVLQRRSPIETEQYVASTLDGHGVQGVELQCPRKDGQWVDISLTTARVLDAEGKVLGVLRVMMDISDRLRAQAELQRQELAFIQVANSCTDWVVRFDTQFRYLYANQAIADALGLVPATFLGKTNRELGVPESLTSAWEEALVEVLHSGLAQEVHLTLAQGKDAKHYTAQVIPEFSRNHTVASLLCIASLQSQQTLPQFSNDSSPREELLTSATLLRHFVAGRRNFAGANLRGIKLSHAFLPEIDLSGAYLNGSDLSHSNLQNACLRGADLRGANLKGANLTGADLHGADLKGADLKEAIGVDWHALE